jgi:hypothetical protein
MPITCCDDVRIEAPVFGGRVVARRGGNYRLGLQHPAAASTPGTAGVVTKRD